MFGAETHAAPDLVDHALHGPLEAGGRGDVVDPAARRADQVMVMFGEVFGELVARELVVGDDAMHDPRLFEHHEIAVHRALLEPGAMFEDLRDRERARRAGQHVDQGHAVGREPLIGLPKA